MWWKDPALFSAPSPAPDLPINSSEAETAKPFHSVHTKKGFVPNSNLHLPVLVTLSPVTPVWTHTPPHSHIPGAPEAEGGFQL